MHSQKILSLVNAFSHIKNYFNSYLKTNLAPHSLNCSTTCLKYSHLRKAHLWISLTRQFFFMWMFMVINFPLKITFIVSLRHLCAVMISFDPKTVIVSSFTCCETQWFKNAHFNFDVFALFPWFLLSLISSFTALWSDNLHRNFSVIF